MRRHLLLGQGDSQRLGLRRINVLDTHSHPVHPVLPVLAHGVGCTHTEHRTNHTPAVRLNENGVHQRIPGHRGMWVETGTALGCAKSVYNRERIRSIGQQNTVHCDGCPLIHARRGNPRDAPGRKLREEVKDRRRRHVLRDRGQQRHGLHNTHRMTLGRLDRTHKAPRGAMQLARCQQLARLLHRRLNTTKVAQGRGVGHPSQHLRNTHLGGI